MPVFVHRRNHPGVAGWAAVASALDRAPSLTSLNGCGQYAAIRAGGQAEVGLKGTELALWAVRFLERSAATLTTLDMRCDSDGPVPAPCQGEVSLVRAVERAGR